MQILTNSLETNNHHSAQAAYENDKRWFLRHGIELWELTGCNHLHAKAAVIDGCIAVIGSYNFDMLSEKRNSEVAVAIYDQTDRRRAAGVDRRPSGELLPDRPQRSPDRLRIELSGRRPQADQGNSPQAADRAGGEAEPVARREKGRVGSSGLCRPFTPRPLAEDPAS